MILLAAAFLAGDAWTWEVAIRYDDADGPLLNDRERWTLRVGRASELTAERAFLGTLVEGDTLVPPSDPRPEVLKGKVEADGTLSLRGDWSDPAATLALRHLLKQERVARRATIIRKNVRPPGGEIAATLTIDVVLKSARLGGKELDLKAPSLRLGEGP